MILRRQSDSSQRDQDQQYKKIMKRLILWIPIEDQRKTIIQVAEFLDTSYDSIVLAWKFQT